MTRPDYREQLLIDADHPALAGHFPGNPVVPGVVLLDACQEACARMLGCPVRVVGLPRVKFLRALRPGERAELVLTGEPPRIGLRIVCSGQTVASGELELAR
ncbi:MAG TPA: hypothetical protein VFG21_03795 [Xanthomonadaceae bacterium]|nr:hypothetical protein [Xanthomonadaceae bacterium]